MNFPTAQPLVLCLLLASMSVGTAQETAPEPAASPARPEKVTKLDGTSLFGLVILTDDYTLKVSNDSGILNIPLALLGEKDFQKYSGKKDRQNDGRLWSERQDALEKEKSEKPEKSAVIEVHLREIAVFQPVISAYEMTLASKASPSPAKEGRQTSEKEGASSDVKLFSGPNALPVVPFSGQGSSFARPAVSAGASVIQSATSLGTPTAPVPPAP
jgi:hypothetical protein